MYLRRNNYSAQPYHGVACGHLRSCHRVKVPREKEPQDEPCVSQHTHSARNMSHCPGSDTRLSRRQSHWHKTVAGVFRHGSVYRQYVHGLLCPVRSFGRDVSFQKKLKKNWMKLHRILTVLFIAAIVIHVFQVGISLPRALHYEEAKPLPRASLRSPAPCTTRFRKPLTAAK